MSWRLIIVIVIFAVFLAFITFNLDNRCNVNFGFKEFKDVPVFMTIFVSFVLGLICTFPLFLKSKKSRKDKERTDDTYSPPPPIQSAAETSDKIKQEAASARESSGGAFP